MLTTPELSGDNLQEKTLWNEIAEVIFAFRFFQGHMVDPDAVVRF